MKGDLDDAASLEAALTGAWGAFAVQNTWEAGVEGEEEQGKRFATLARKVGVQHFVYSSVGSAHRETGIPHFENKWRIEETIRGLGFPSHVIIRPVFFMENLTTPWFLNGDKLCAAMNPKHGAADDRGGRHRQVRRPSVHGCLGAQWPGDRSRRRRGEPCREAAKILGSGLGRTIEFVHVPIEEVRKNSEDFASMLEWFDRVGYNADIAGLEREFGIKPTRLAEWAGRQRG